jgi:hypothetical protein
MEQVNTGLLWQELTANAGPLTIPAEQGIICYVAKRTDGQVCCVSWEGT